MENKTIEDLQENLNKVYPNQNISVVSIEDFGMVIVKTDLGLCKTFKKNLLKGHFPGILTALDKTDYFINKVKKVHHTGFSFDRTVYKNSSTLCVITCQEHGDFKISPGNLLNGRRCPKCNIKDRKITTEVIRNTKELEKKLKKENKEKYKLDIFRQNFINHTNTKFNNKYTYDIQSIISLNSPIRVKCPNHGWFETTIFNHRSSLVGCRKCSFEQSSTKTTLDINIKIDRFNSVHKGNYEYILDSFNVKSQKIDIICKIHGVFTQSIHNHLKGQGCPTCGVINKKSSYNRSNYTLYLVKLYNNSESFIKVGVCGSYKKRSTDLRSYGYDLELINIIDANKDSCYDLELQVLKLFDTYKYTPIKKFSGKNECFVESIGEEISNFINEKK